MMKNKLDIILPIYHEEETIARVIKNIEKNVYTPHKLIFIYDSTDDPTLKIIPKKKNIVIVKNKFGTGIVNAIKTGFSVSSAQYIILMMADGSDNPADIDKMVKKLENSFDIVCASRYTGQGARQGGPILKGLFSRIACLTLHYIADVPTTDATNAFKGFRNSVVKKIKIESRGGFELPLEIVVKSWQKGYKIGEIPTKWKEREKGKSKFKLLKWIPHYLKWYFLAIRIRLNS